MEYRSREENSGRTLAEMDNIIFENSLKRVSELREKENLSEEEKRELSNLIELVRLSCGM